MATQGYKRYIHENEISLIPKAFSILIDKETGYEYIIEMSNGQLTTRLKLASININKISDKAILRKEDEKFVLDGATIYGTLQDGSTMELTDYTINIIDIANEPFTIEVVYTDSITYTSKIEIDLCLLDFDYILEEDGTYTLTAWKGTCNGEPSTEIIIPNSELINL